MPDTRSQRRDLLILYGSQTGNAQVRSDRCPPHQMYLSHPSTAASAQDVAERIGREGKRRHFTTRIMAMDAFPVNHLPQASAAVFICSTTGQVSAASHTYQTLLQPLLALRPQCGAAEQGEVPSNMKTFWRFLLRKSLPADSLKAMQAAVFGLGDSGTASQTLCSFPCCCHAWAAWVA